MSQANSDALGHNTCPACGYEDGACYQSANGRYRIFCAMCGHSTAFHPDLTVAQLEWIGHRV